METLTFSIYQLIINSEKPSVSIFSEFSDESFDYNGNKYILFGKLFDNRFFWIYAIYGKPLPYSDKIINTKTSQITENLRKKEDAELNYQIFSIYDSKRNDFYISKSKEKFLEVFLKKKLSKDIKIKKQYISPDQFIKKIKSIDRINLTSKENLFSENSGLFEDVKDIFGLGQPEDFKIDISYKGQGKTESFKTFFNRFVEKRQNKEIDSLICIGKDDKDMELIFDIKSYTKKIQLDVEKNNSGLYNDIEVKNEVIKKIKLSDKK